FDFTSTQPPATPPNTSSQMNKAATVQPGGLAFDSSGRLYVADNYARVLVFQAPGGINGQSADRVLGIAPGAPGSKLPAYPTTSTLGNINVTTNAASAPAGVFTAGGSVFVAD